MIKRMGILGGTFDPIHSGHLRLLEAAKKHYQLDTVWVVPNWQNPLKQKGGTPVKHRLAMIRLAIHKMKGVRLSLFEIKRKGKSFSIDTLKYFKKRYSANTEWFWIGGTDLLANLKQWKKVNTFLSQCRLVIGQRPGYKKINPGKRWEYFPMKPISISGTSLRQGKSQSLPLPVKKYIMKHKLYDECERTHRVRKIKISLTAPGAA